MAKYKKNEILEVHWEDVETDNDWQKEERAGKFALPQCLTIGYFLNQDKNCIRVSHTVQVNKEKDRDVTVMPKGVIKDIRRIK